MGIARGPWVRFLLIGIGCAVLSGSALWPQREALSAPGPSPVTAVASAATAAAWAATEDGAVADLLVILAPQVDIEAIRAETRVPAVRRRLLHHALVTTALTSQQGLRAWLEAHDIPYRPLYIVNALRVHASRETLWVLAQWPGVRTVITNPHVAGLPSPDLRTAMEVDEQAAQVPWGVAQIRAPSVWAMGYDGAGVVVGVQDTGFRWDHPALQPHYRGWDGVTASHDYNWHDAIHEAVEEDCGADSLVPCDDLGHGTHVLGTVVGDDGGTHQVGVAPGARWIGCRNMAQGVGSPASYAECFEFFLAPYPVDGDPTAGDPDLAPDIVSNSWTCPPSEGCDAIHRALLEQVVETVRTAGILVVAAAGNAGPSCGTVTDPPATFHGVMTVGATGSTDAIASFSSRGAVGGALKPELVAPGVDVLSTTRGGSYGYLSGTSMATPHVAGAAALVWSARPDLRGRLVPLEALLTVTAHPRTSTQCGDAPEAVPNHVYGWGRLDVYSATVTALNQGLITGRVTAGSGEPLEGVSVVATALDGTWTTVTQGEGEYALWVPPGGVTVTMTLMGYRTAVNAQVSSVAGATTELDVVLEEARIFLPLVSARADP